jgi:hypothetical protein
VHVLSDQSQQLDAQWIRQQAQADVYWKFIAPVLSSLLGILIGKYIETVKYSSVDLG